MPSTHRSLFAWWNRACADPTTERSDGLPECGYYKRRLVKGGPWVAARIWCERDIEAETGELTAPERLRCEVDGSYRDPADQWTYLIPITRAEYDAILHRRLGVAEMTTPTQSIDLTRRPIWTP